MSNLFNGHHPNIRKVCQIIHKTDDMATQILECPYSSKPLQTSIRHSRDHKRDFYDHFRESILQDAVQVIC